MCVLGGDWRFPDEGPRTKGKDKGTDKTKTPAVVDEGVSEAVREVVRRCLRVEPAERPDVDELIAMVESVVAGLPLDDDGIEE